MQRLFIAIISACAFLYPVAQTLEQTAGIYYAYPGPSVALTAAPDGYKPFYISHYGRHGSRWVTEDKRYTDVADMFECDSCLTSLGLEVKQRLALVLDDALGRSGSLSHLGEKQHHDIATRMYTNYPEVFTDTSTVKAVSSTSLRCAMSMSFFTEALKEQVPALHVSRTAYARDMDYIAYISPEGKAFSSDSAAWRADYWAFVREMVNPARLASSLFVDPDRLTDEQKFNLVTGLYWIASDMQDVDVDITFYDIFTPDELCNLWRCINARMYICNGNSPKAQGVMKHCADNLLNDFINCADQALAGNGVSANLRFGHDTHLLRLLSLMGIDGCAAQMDDITRIHEVWQDYNLSPMAANLQMIFFSNDSGDVIVKLLLNEKEVTLPITSINNVYYSWPELREYLVSQLAN